NDTGLVPHQSSRTDGEYLQLIQQLPKPTPYQTLLVTHQELCFSNTEASRSVFDQCQEAYREIDAPSLTSGVEHGGLEEEDSPTS
ncbi:MAG: DUF4129 domain-containing protein, partial [Coleofasciculus sp. Co-bin14]|nr:DUF4129 domain-containing protein [Coleofasciculus sp. Co-bin14]